jgi:glycine betaine transporter
MQNEPFNAIPGTQRPPLLTLIALCLAAMLAGYGIFAPESFMASLNSWNSRFMDSWSGGVLTISTLMLLGCVALAISPLGRIRLGDADSRPEFSTPAWLAMLFAAGMGAGLLYWGVAEPITHMAHPPPYAAAMAEAGNARMAMVVSYLHWALHPWGIYAAGGLCIAYFSFCKGHSLLPSAPFRAVLPARFGIGQTVGGIVDVACVISLLLGLSASMAAGIMQMASGTKWLGNTATANGGMFPTYVALAVPLVAVYLLSAATSIHKGIKRLSELNMLLACLLAVVIALNGSLPDILTTLALAVGDYLRFLPELSVMPLDSPAQPDWSKTWTANYFLSWIAWVPFVGIFIARISRGRRLREFVLGVVLAPSLFTFLWFAILGNAAIDMQLSGALDIAAAVDADSGAGLFALLSLFPAKEILWLLVMMLVFIFLVTSADSASFVLAMMAGQGEANPPVRVKLFWGLAIAVLALAALFSESGIHSVRAVFSCAGIAVFFILAAQMLCLMIGMIRNKHR